MIYAASKHAVTVLTEGFRQEMAKRKIKIKFTVRHKKTESVIFFKTGLD